MDDGRQDALQFEARGLSRRSRLTRHRDAGEAVLEEAFETPLPEPERAMWAAMSTAQRALAVRRLKVLLLAESKDAPLAADRAAISAGLSLNRWYEMFGRWRESRSLSSIGISAALPRTRTLWHHTDTQRLVVEIVHANPHGSVRQVALALDEALRREVQLPQDKKWPSYNTLRKFAEDEMRRRVQEVSPGNDLMLDCCACKLPHADGIFVAFLALDKASRAILGAALGDPADSRAGYALAAADALKRIERSSLVEFAWAERLVRSELVVGLDENAWAGIREEVVAAGLRGQLQPASSKRRFGMYVRRLLGGRVGRIKFLPGKTQKLDTVARPDADDLARLAIEIDVHNEGRFQPAIVAPDAMPPPELIATLRFLAG